MTDGNLAYLRRLDSKQNALLALAVRDSVEAEVLSLIRVWRECPKGRRPSIEALAERITAALSRLE
jgi:hypothetical protein